MRWDAPAVVAPEVLDELCRGLETCRAIAAILIGRGVRDVEEARSFLSPRLSSLSDPFLLPGMKPAVERLWKAVEASQSILIYGDYDVDGVTASALLFSVFQRLGGNVNWFVPNRLDEGYGLSVEGAGKCLDGHPHVVVTVDCGTCAEDGVGMLNDVGVDVIVTDHHEVAGNTAPALAVVNPKLGNDARTRDLSGVGVAFKLCHAMIKEGLDAGRAAVADVDLREWLDMVALGTIADMVPLTDENRILVYHGLRQVNSFVDGKRPDIPGGRRGLQALMEVARMEEAVRGHHVGFVLGPRLNAAGRLGNADDALRLLLAEESDEALALARRLDEANRERRKIEDRILEEAKHDIDAYFDESTQYGVTAAKTGWHLGTLGIVASRLCAAYRRPSIVIGFDDEGVGRGSCRSVGDADMMAILERCRSLLESYGGHRMAAGIEIREKNLESFQARFNEVCAAELSGVDLRPSLHVDAWVSLGEIDRKLLNWIDRLRPFGIGNPEPVLGSRGVVLSGPPKVLSRNTLKMKVASGGAEFTAVGFDMGHREIPKVPLDIVYKVKENVFRGMRNLELVIKDFREAQDNC